MRAAILVLSLAGVALAGCRQNEQAFVDNLVREAVSNTGAPQEVSMTRQADNSFSGTASVRRTDGQTVRFNCTARRQGDTTRYEAVCLPVVDQAMVDAMKAEIRRGLTANGAEIVSLELSRQDENRMAGFVEVRDGNGTLRAPCEATREAPDSAAFRWQCRPPEGAAAAGEAGQQAQPPAEGQAPAEPAQ